MRVLLRSNSITRKPNAKPLVMLLSNGPIDELIGRVIAKASKAVFPSYITLDEIAKRGGLLEEFKIPIIVYGKEMLVYPPIGKSFVRAIRSAKTTIPPAIKSIDAPEEILEKLKEYYFIDNNKDGDGRIRILSMKLPHYDISQPFTAFSRRYRALLINPDELKRENKEGEEFLWIIAKSATSLPFNITDEFTVCKIDEVTRLPVQEIKPPPNRELTDDESYVQISSRGRIATIIRQIAGNKYMLKTRNYRGYDSDNEVNHRAGFILEDSSELRKDHGELEDPAHIFETDILIVSPRNNEELEELLQSGIINSAQVSQFVNILNGCNTFGSKEEEKTAAYVPKEAPKAELIPPETAIESGVDLTVDIDFSAFPRGEPPQPNFSAFGRTTSGELFPKDHSKSPIKRASEKKEPKE